jgi:hypothetical protein
MRPLLVLLLAGVLAACGSDSAPTTTSTSAPPSTTTTAVPQTTTSAPLTDCPRAPYEVGVFPSGVGDAQVPAEGLALDPFTSVPGSHSTIWVTDDGALALALVRGTLPPEQWPGERGEVEIDGVRAVVGPFDDGSWVAAWFEEPGDRCDLYTMVFYPPVEPGEVEATLESMDRVAG